MKFTNTNKRSSHSKAHDSNKADIYTHSFLKVFHVMLVPAKASKCTKIRKKYTNLSFIHICINI